MAGNYSRDYIRMAYNMPKLKKCLKIIYQGKEGKITGFSGSYILIRIPTCKIPLRCHPKDEDLQIIFEE